MSDDQVTALTETFQRELIALVQQPRFNTIPYPVIIGLLSLVAYMMREGAVQDPATLPTLLLHIDQLRAFVETAEQAGAPTKPIWH